MIIFSFLAATALGIIIAYTFKVLLSGNTMGYVKLYAGLAVNFFFMYIHGRVLEFNEFPYFGHHPEIIENHPVIGWIAFICIPVHALAIPVKHEVRWLFSKRIGKP